MTGGTRTPAAGTGSPALAAIRRQMRATPAVVAYMLVAGLLACVPGLAVPLLIRVFLDQYLVAGGTEWAWPVVAGLVVMAACTGLLSWLQFRVLARLAVRLSAATSTRYVWHALRISTTDAESYGAGSLVARAAGLQRQAFQGGVYVPLALVKVLTLVVYLTALLALDVRLGLVAAAVVLASIAVGVRLLAGRRRLQTDADRARMAQTALTTDLVAAIETVKASAAEQWVFDRWSLARSRTGTAVAALSADGRRLAGLPALTQTMGLGLVLAAGTWLVATGQLSLGTLIAAQAVLVALLIPAGQLIHAGTLLEAVSSTQAQADEVRALPLDVEVRRPGVAPPARTTREERRVGAALESVRFGYRPDAAPLMDGLTLDVPAGSWVAVVGGSGSGKSTLARLLVGELQPWAGRVLLDGRDRLDVPRRRRAAAVGYVPQYPVLMPGTVADNITLFDDRVPAAAVTAALRDACVADAVAARPGGLLAEVGATGHGFSGGELQRLAIARALVGDPGLLVLDEATSALDPLVEAEVIARLRDRGVTCLLVAHRLSTVRDADHIVVLDRGVVVESGSYERLRRGGRFAELAHG